MLVGDVLLVRNGEEMAAFHGELGLEVFAAGACWRLFPR
jgi:hypothetical protein